MRIFVSFLFLLITFGPVHAAGALVGGHDPRYSYTGTQSFQSKINQAGRRLYKVRSISVNNEDSKTVTSSPPLRLPAYLWFDREAVLRFITLLVPVVTRLFKMPTPSAKPQRDKAAVMLAFSATQKPLSVSRKFNNRHLHSKTQATA